MAKKKKAKAKQKSHIYFNDLNRLGLDHFSNPVRIQKITVEVPGYYRG